MKKFLKEFREFAVKGNVIDLAVAVIIGGAFGKIVSSLVADIVMPPLGVLMGGINFNDWKFVLKQGVNGAPDVTLNIGTFIQNVVDFLIIALVIFLMVRIISHIKKRLEADKNKQPQPPQPVPLTKDQELLTEIRDSLRAKNNSAPGQNNE